MRWVFLFIILFVCGSCSVERQYDNYSMTQADLTLTANNHPHGYTRSQCFSCHLPQNIHQVDRVGAPSFAYARSLVESQGLNSCSGCHGYNGVAQ